MERLTFVKCPKYWGKGRHPTKYTSRKTFQEVVDRLAYYEDMEEQGRLVVLPCKAGDTVWVKFANGVRPYVVDRINVIAQNQVLVRMRFMVNEILRLSADNFGKTVFLTREEAEKALATDKNDGRKIGGAE